MPSGTLVRGFGREEEWNGNEEVGSRGRSHTPISGSPSFGRKQNLKEVVENIMLIKEKVKEKLRLLGTPGSWNHITDQKGTHGYLGLDCKYLGEGSSPLSDLGLILEH